MKPLALISALSRNHVIGRDGDLPWSVPEDLRRVKKITMGHTLIMGRRTFESIGRPLPGRPITVVSRSMAPLAGITIVPSLGEAIDEAQSRDALPFLFGGAAIYGEGLARVTHMFLTRIERDVQGDTYFPAFDAADWTVVHDELVPGYSDVRFVDMMRKGFMP